MKIENALFKQYGRWIVYLIMSTTLVVFFYIGKDALEKCYKKHQVIGQFQELVDIINGYSKKHIGYKGLNNSYFRFDPPHKNVVFHTASNWLESDLGGHFSVYGVSDDLSGKTDNSYIIIYKGIDRDMCIDLASYDWKKLKNTSVISILVSSDSRKLPLKEMQWGCKGAIVADKYAIGCFAGSNIGLPLSEFQARAVCKYGSTLVLKLY